MPFFLACIGGVLFSCLSLYFPITAGCSLLLVALYFLSRRKFVLLAALSISFFTAFLRQEPAMEPFFCQSVIMKASTTSLPEENKHGYRQESVVTAVEGCDQQVTAKRITLFTKSPVPPCTSILFFGSLKGTWLPRNPYNTVRTFALSGTVREIFEQSAETGFRGRIQRLRMTLREEFRREFSEETAGLLSAVVIGVRGSLPDGMIHSFSMTGLSHLLAISGTHFGIFSILIFSGIRSVILRLPYPQLYRVSMYLKPSAAAALASSPFMVFYLVLSGMGVPAVRSFFMINVVLLGLLLEKKAPWRNSLLFAGTVILLFSPAAITDPSFLLSFSAVAAIGITFEWRGARKREDFPLPEYIKTLKDRAIERLEDMTYITAAAIAGTLPLTMYFFHSLPIAAFPVNMIITPFVCFLVIPLAMLSSILFLLTGFFPFSSLIEFLCSPVLIIVKTLSTIQFFNVPVQAFPAAILLIALMGLTLLFLAKRKRAGWFIICSFVLLSFIYPCLNSRPHFEITFLDTGQSESAVMSMPDGKVFAIDTGRNGKYTSRYLDYLGARTVNAVFLSHGGMDHSGGLEYLLMSKDIKYLFDNGDLTPDFRLPDGVRRKRLLRGDTLSGPGYAIETLHPHDGFLTLAQDARSDNNGSLVLRLTVDGYRILFTGDIEEEAERDMYILRSYLESDVIKVAHHGSRTSTTAEFLSLSRPSLAVISSGKFNMYGHPHEETMVRLTGMRTLNTAENGAIKISIVQGTDGPSLAVKTFDDFMLRNVRSPRDELINYTRLFKIW